MTERRGRVPGPPRALEVAWGEPAGPVRGGALVCHPHPQFGGSMDNTVVVAIAGAFAADGVLALRFNFGGVGASEGAFSGGPEEVGDARRAWAALAGRMPAGAPVTLAGYSYGAWITLQLAAGGPPAAAVIAVAPPLDFLDWDFLATLPGRVTFVVGDRDQYCGPARLDATLAATGGRIRVHTIAGVDHFFAGHEAQVAAAVAEVWSGARGSPGPSLPGPVRDPAGPCVVPIRVAERHASAR